MKPLREHFRKIAAGERRDLPHAKVLAYRAQFAAQGFDLPPEPEPWPNPKPPSARNVPGIGKRIKNFAGAAARHVANKGKRRDEAEVDRLYAICQTNQCGQFNVNGECNLCGCPLKGGVAGKLAWESEHCPVGLW